MSDSAIPQTAAHQAPPFLGFSRQEYWSGLPFPSPRHKSESEVAQLCPTLRDPMDWSLPVSSVHGIFQVRVLEWDAITLVHNYCLKFRLKLKKVGKSTGRRQWHPTPVLLPGKSHGWRRLVGCSPWGRKESDTTK